MNTIERAFQLAPGCSSTQELRRALQNEGCGSVDVHLSGLGIKRELRKLYNGGSGMKKRGPKSTSSPPHFA